MRVRLNILVIALFVFLTIGGIVGILIYALSQGGTDNDFVIGALIGLLGTGIISLTSLGNNILEKDGKPTPD